MAQLKRYNGTSWETVGGVVTGDTLPIGSEVDYNGASAPAGWEEISNDLVVDSIRTKNIFGNYTIVNGYLFETRMSIRNIASDRLAFIECKPNTTYTISRSVITTSFRVSDYTSIPQMTGSYVDYTVPTVIENNSGTTITYTTSASAKYLIIHYGNVNNDTATNLINTLKTMQVEEGNTATTFSPYQNLTGNENYATEETRIGTWIDGKPLYRKVVSSTTPSQANTGTNIYDASSLNIDRLVNLSFTFKGSYNEYATASNVIIMFTRITETSRNIGCTCTIQDYCNKPFYFILEYTKTTD